MKQNDAQQGDQWYKHKNRLTSEQWRASLRKYVVGTIRTDLRGDIRGLDERTPRVVVCGGQSHGKSDLINSLLMAWAKWEEYQELCPLSTNSAPGTYIFDGPFHCYGDDRENAILDIFDTAGFSYTADQITRRADLIIRFSRGEIVPGTSLLQTRNARMQKPNLISLDNWSGVDCALLVAQYEDRPAIDNAVGVINMLRANNLASMLVLTNSGEHTTNDYLQREHGDVKYFCIECTGRNGIQDEKREQSLPFLRLIGEIIQLIENHGTPVPSPNPVFVWPPQISINWNPLYLTFALFLLVVALLWKLYV